MKLLLFIMIAFIAFTSTISGLLMIYQPDGSILQLSPSLLVETPFKNFLVPGILLTVVVGGINMFAVFYNMQRHPGRYNWAMAGGFMTSCWILVQLMLINAVHWLQFVYLATGVLIILIAYQLKGKWAV